MIFDTKLKIEEAAKGYKDFDDRDFIKGYISFDKHKETVLEDDVVESSGSPARKRKRNGA